MPFWGGGAPFFYGAPFFSLRFSPRNTCYAGGGNCANAQWSSADKQRSATAETRMRENALRVPTAVCQRRNCANAQRSAVEWHMRYAPCIALYAATRNCANAQWSAAISRLHSLLIVPRNAKCANAQCRVAVEALLFALFGGLRAPSQRAPENANNSASAIVGHLLPLPKPAPEAWDTFGALCSKQTYLGATPGSGTNLWAAPIIARKESFV